MSYTNDDAVLEAFIGHDLEALPLPPRMPTAERLAADYACAVKVAHQLGVTMRPGSGSTRPGFRRGGQ